MAFVKTTKLLTLNAPNLNHFQLQFSRNFFGYFRIAFNRVDKDRLESVGPDRLCSEWLLKNGGAVRFNGKALQKDYNTLPPQNQREKIQEVDATESTIMAIGFEHFRNCDGINKIILHKCKHMENEALNELILLNNTLKHLQVSECYNVVDSGLKSLGQLTNLEKLIIFGMPYVKDIKAIEMELRSKLPKCDIDIKA